MNHKRAPIVLVFDRELSIGEHRYLFYLPLSIGEFLITVWKVTTTSRLVDELGEKALHQTSSGNKKTDEGDVYGAQIHRSGQHFPIPSEWGWGSLEKCSLRTVGRILNAVSALTRTRDRRFVPRNVPELIT